MTRTLWLLLILGGCLAEGTEDEDVDVGETEQAAYSSWTQLGIYDLHAQIRVCKTATRINWQFQNSNFSNVRTFGDGISSLSTNISGVSSGSKYRTRGGTWMTIEFWTGNNGALRWFPFSLMPDC